MLELCVDRLDDNPLVGDFGAEVMACHVDVSGSRMHLGHSCHLQCCGVILKDFPLDHRCGSHLAELVVDFFQQTHDELVTVCCC